MTDIVYGIRLTGDARDAKKAFQETRGEQDRLTGAERENVRVSREVQQSNELKTATLNRLRLAAAAAGAAILAAMRQTVAAAAEAERSIARLNAVWRATGGTTGLSRAQQEALAQRMAGETRFNDEEIRDAMAMLATFRQISGDTFVDTLDIAASLAEVMRTDLRSAIMQLGKALEDPVRGVSQLREVGVSFNDAQLEMIKGFVESGNQAKAMDMILRTLREQGLAGVAQEMNQGVSKALSDNTKLWRELLQAIGGTQAVQTPTIGFFSGVNDRLREMKDLIERGTWTQRLLYIMSGTAPGRILEDIGGVPLSQGAQVGPVAADPNSPEAAGARRAAQVARWDADFSRYQARLRVVLEDSDKAGVAAGQAHDRMMADAQSAVNRELTNVRGDLDAIDKANDAASKLHLARLRREDEALEKAEDLHRARVLEAQTIRELVDPWAAYGAEIERLNKLYELGYISAEEYGKAAAAAAERSIGSLAQMSADGADTFEDLKAAVDDFGRELARSLASGEAGFRSLTDVASRFLEELLAIQLEKRLISPLLGAGTSFLDNLFTGSSAPGAYTGSAAPMHTGGIVGLEGGARRYVHPGYFERAPRLHSGGLVGGEVPAILRRGEGVFTPEQMRAMGGGNLTVNVINESGVPLQGQASAPRPDLAGMVVDLVLRRLSTDATARQQLGGQLSRPQH